MMGNGYENGASIIHAGDFVDPTAIPATISLPAAVWERLTADLRDDDRMSLDRPELPDTPLGARIAMFLEMQVVEWEVSSTDYPTCDAQVGEGDDDFDGGVGF